MPTHPFPSFPNVQASNQQAPTRRRLLYRSKPEGASRPVRRLRETPGYPLCQQEKGLRGEDGALGWLRTGLLWSTLRMRSSETPAAGSPGHVRARLRGLCTPLVRSGHHCPHTVGLCDPTSTLTQIGIGHLPGRSPVPVVFMSLAPTAAVMDPGISRRRGLPLEYGAKETGLVPIA